MRGQRDLDLQDEIDTHLALAEEEYRRAGMSDEDARDAARRAFGGVLKARQLYREQGGWRWLDTLLQDARFGVRVLVRDRAFALTAIVVLGLGIGVNNMQFTIIYAHTLRGLPIERAGRVLMASFVDERGADQGLSVPEFQELQAGADRFHEFAALGSAVSVALGDPGRAPDRYLAIHTTGNALEVLRIQPLMGRAFTKTEEQPGARRVTMLGAGAWRARYNADPAILGREVLIDGESATVVGIIRERSGFPSNAEVLLPIAQAAGFSPIQRDIRALRAFARIRDDVSIEEARAQLETLLVQTADASGASGRGLLPRVTPISARFIGRATDPAWMAFFAVGFLVVAVASANAANLMLARGVRRAHEMAIRASLGANRARVVVQLLTESVVIASLAALVGLAVSVAGVRMFRAGVPVSDMPYWWHYSMDLTVFAVLVLVSFGTVLIFGLVPALQSSRADVARVMKDGGRSGTGRTSSRWLTTGFMVAQLALSVVLTSYVVINVFDNDAPASDAVVETTDVLTASLRLSADRYPTVDQRAGFLERLAQQIRAIPGVSAATLTSALPRNGATEERLQLAASAPRDQLPAVWTVQIGSDYFRTLGLPLQRGREFASTEPQGATPALVNERFVERFLPAADPIGQQIAIVSANPRGGATTPVTIVGVAQDIRHRPGRPDPVVYLPLSATAPALISVMVRSQLDTLTTTSQLRDAVLALDANLPVFQAMTLARAVDDAMWNIRVSSRLVTVLSLIVILLSSVGLYAVTAHAVSQRAKEIGIRTALGAKPAQIRRLVLRSAAVQVALGLFFGVLCTLAWDGAFFTRGVETRFADVRVLGPVGLIFAILLLAACLAPTRRATRLDPVATLRQD
jgi:putative ABC transport system permease protein